MEYSDENIETQAVIFYDNVRTLVVVFLTVSFLLPLSYFTITSRRKLKTAWLSKDDASAHRFVIGVCTWSLTVSIIMVFMLPFSILANEVLIAFPESYYVQWINSELPRNFFTFTTINFKCLCVLIPFSLFFLLSHGVHKSRNALSARSFYAFLYLVISYVATFGVLSTLSASFSLTSDDQNVYVPGSGLPSHSKFCSSTTFFYYTWPIGHLSDFMCYLDSALLVMEKIFSYTGLGLLLVCIPFGIQEVILQTLRMRQPPPRQYRYQIVDEKYRLQLQTCLEYIKRLNRPFPCVEYSTRYSQSYRAHFLHDMDPFSQMSDLDALSDNGDSEEYQQKTLVSAGFVFLLIVLILIVLTASAYTAVNVVALLWGLILSNGNESSASHAADVILLGRESVSKFGFLGATVQVLMVMFVTFSSLIGFYSMPFVRKHLYPLPHAASTGLLLINAACILSMASAAPLQASLLGLATPSFPPTYFNPLVDCCTPPVVETCEPPKPLTPSAESARPTLPALLNPLSSSNSQQVRPPGNEDTGMTFSKCLLVAPVAATQSVAPSTTPTVGGISDGAIALYNLGFIATSWWLFRRNWTDLKQACSAVGSLVVRLGGKGDR